MTIKETYLRLVEIYLNDIKKELIEDMYGKGTVIKIRSLSEIISNNAVMVDAVIILGDVITEEIMDRNLADILIQDALKFFFPKYSTKVMIRWDC